MERKIFNNIIVYGSNSVVGLSGETSFNSLDKAFDFFCKLSDRINDSGETIYLILKQIYSIFIQIYSIPGIDSRLE